MTAGHCPFCGQILHATSAGRYARSLRFVFAGKIKPYVRMTRRSKYANPAAQEYLASKEAIQWQMKQQMGAAGMLAAQTPLSVIIEFHIRERMHTMDLDNLIKAILDAGNGIAYPDDRWIDQIVARRRPGTAYRTVMTVQELPDCGIVTTSPPLSHVQQPPGHAV